MHIGYVLKKFPRASETFILNEILALQRQGVDVSVFSLNRPDDGVFHRELADLARPVVYLPTRKAEGWLLHLRQHREELRAAGAVLLLELDDMLGTARLDVWSVLGLGLDLALLARQHDVQHLHAHFATVAAYTARAAAALTGLPFSVTCHAKDIYRDAIVPAHFQSLLAKSAFVVTVCEANRRWIETQLAGDTRIDVRVLYNGVDTALFHPRHRTPATASTLLAPTLLAPTLLAVGRLVEKKGLHVLLDALGMLARDGMRPRCVIAGDGEERTKLEAQAARLGLANFEFTGMRTHDEVRDLVHQAHLMVLPCLVGRDGNRDALPTVLLESLAAGLPVLSTAIGGIGEIVDDGRAGVLVPAGEAAPLAAEIDRLLRHPQQLAALAAAGRARAESLFDLAHNVATLKGYYEDAINRVACPRGVLP